MDRVIFEFHNFARRSDRGKSLTRFPQPGGSFYECSAWCLTGSTSVAEGPGSTAGALTNFPCATRTLGLRSRSQHGTGTAPVFFFSGVESIDTLPVREWWPHSNGLTQPVAIPSLRCERINARQHRKAISQSSDWPEENFRRGALVCGARRMALPSITPPIIFRHDPQP